MRGVVAVLVVLFHSQVLLPRGSSLPLIQHGGLAVDVFFVLSGYVLAHRYGGRTGERRGYLRFLSHRVARLWPLQVVTLLLQVGAYALVVVLDALPGFSPPGNDPRWSWSALPLHLLLVHLFFAPLTWNFPSWSLSGEMYGSALLGPLLRSSRRGRRAAACGALVASSAVVWHVQSAGHVDSYSFARVLLGLSLGAFVAQLDREWIPAVPPGAVLAGLALGFWWMGRTATTLELFPWCAAVAVMLIARTDQDGARSILTSDGAQWLGRISFSLYLLHAVVLTVVQAPRDAFFLHLDLRGQEYVGSCLYLGTLATVLMLATFSYDFIEVPAQRALRRRFDARLDRGLAAPEGYVDLREPVRSDEGAAAVRT